MLGFKINPTKDFEYVILDALGLNIARYIIAACINLCLNTNNTHLLLCILRCYQTLNL